MPCEHNGPVEVIAMAEEWLRDHDVDESEWPGALFRWSENVTGGMWASVVIEVERRGAEWIVTRLDRNKEPVAEQGLQRLQSSAYSS
jgi:hypothetical protein